MVARQAREWVEVVMVVPVLFLHIWSADVFHEVWCVAERALEYVMRQQRSL